MLELAVKFYDYYSSVEGDRDYWDEVYDMAHKTLDRFEGQERRLATKIMLAIWDCLEIKYKDKTQKG